MPTELFDGRFSPITSAIGFLECDASAAADAFEAWQGPLYADRKVKLSRREVRGSLHERIESLLPLTSIERRRVLFLPTATRWTAFLDNGWRGTDAFSAVSYLATIIPCRGIRATSVPHTMRRVGGRRQGRYGATILELYAENSQGCSFLNIRRSISATNDGGRWRFDAGGEPLPFERLDRYEARRVADRFTPELLAEYVRQFEIDLFSPAFYDVPQPALLVSKTGPCLTGSKEYSLDEARAG